MGLSMGVQHPVEAALRADVAAPIRQDWHDLPRGQSSKFRLIAGEQDPLPLFCAEAVGDMAMTAFAAIDTAPITVELPAPALQRGEPHAQQTSEFASPRTGCHGSIQDLQGPAAINRRGQSSSASPQKAWIFGGNQQCHCIGQGFVIAAEFILEPPVSGKMSPL